MGYGEEEGFASNANAKPSEGFTVPASYKINMPDNVVSATPAPGGNTVKASQLPGGLLAGPYEQIARNTPLPYQDPSLQKTNRTRILKALEDVKGFLAFEAPEIEDKSDPTIQLPLQTLRGDFARLEDEARVLQRNPGLQPDMTETHIAEIESNLAFLQRQVRLIGVNRPFGDYQWDKIALGSGSGSTIRPEGFQNPGQADAPGIDKSDHPEANDPASAEDLKAFAVRLQAEIMRLTASGTTDPVIAARVGNLTQMKQQVQQVLTQLETGQILPSEVPIMRLDIDKALPVLSDPSEPLPQILKQFALPAGWANLLPSNVANDPHVARKINGLVDKYADDLVKGTSVSATFNVKYTSPREAAAAAASTIASTGFPSSADLAAVASAPQFKLADQGTPSGGLPEALPSPFGGIRPILPEPKIGHFDWKTRAKQIEDQVRRRGLNPTDFGILPAGAHIPTDFSWKGYTQMMCSRLQATPDPGLPETCGCPPSEWPGWKL